MTRLGRGTQIGAIALATACISCGGKGGGGGNSGGAGGIPGGPTPVPQANSCRTYPTAATVHTTNSANSMVVDARESGSFDPSSKTSTVQTMFANGAPCSTHITRYDSVADFVDEVRVIPGVFLSTGATNTNSGACGSFTATVTYTYDGQRRLVQEANSVGGSTTYTAWDGSGRPTSGTMSSGTAITNAYDNGARTLTQTQTRSNGTRSVSTMTFDANGAQTQVVVVDGGNTSTTTFTNTATASVCK